MGPVAAHRHTLYVTAGVLAVPRTVFDQVGGSDDAYVYRFAIEDLCVRIQGLGYRNAVSGWSRVVHRDGLTLGGVDRPRDFERWLQRLGCVPAETDPTLHPWWDGDRRSPGMRPRIGGGAVPSVRCVLEGATWPGEDGALDPYSDAEIASVVRSDGWTLPMPRKCEPGEPIDVDRAGEHVLWLLRSDEAVRTRYREAVMQGEQEGFWDWICSKALVGSGLAGCEAAFRAAFKRRFGWCIWRDYLLDRSLHEVFPLALSVFGTRRILRWLIESGVPTRGISQLDVWWFLVETTVSPAWLRV